MIFALLLSLQDASAADFFETRVRPLLAERCYECHSATSKKLKGGLRLDTLDGLRRVAPPGDLERGALIRAVRWQEEDLRMPPKQALPSRAVADIETWIRNGAVLPVPKGRADGPHWAFVPPKDVVPPDVDAPAPLDAFIAARLKEKGLSLSPPAEPRALLRRLSYDLTGLPPTPEELDAFLADPSPGAYEKAVERLLASPRYGERWARHWLDVARYADTTDGAVGDNSDDRLVTAAPYRDWVIRSFNEDLPYDRFVLAQLAADLLPEKAPLEALGFLTLGRRFGNNIHDILDDRLDVIGRGLLGLTISCARCHDHKFDPIPTADYYSLYGVLAASSERVVTLPGSKATRAHEEELKRRRAELKAFIAARGAEVQAHVRERAADYLAAVDGAERPGLDPVLVNYWRDNLKKLPSLAAWKEGKAKAEEVAAELPLLKLAPGSVPHHLFSITANYEITTLKLKISSWQSAGPGAPRQALALEERPPKSDPKIFKRGSPDNPGEAVPRRFLAALSTEPRTPFTGGGRLELARAIARAENPLTARVFVNRVWAQHFGAGLVETPSDFGTRSEAPSHPELLDWLARRFVEDGWSIKALQRRIVLSAAYRQASDDRPAARAVDPLNRLLWRRSPRRLDFEAMRDSILAVAGALEPSLGGASEVLTAQPYSPRRSVYGFVDRLNLSNVLMSFDVANPTSHTPRRHFTTVPQQALFLMNSPFLMEQARRLVASVPGDGDARTRALYRRVYGRAPTDIELDAARRFLRETAADPEPAPSLWSYGYGEVGERGTSFKPFAVFTGEAWQESAYLPDPGVGPLMLDATGGHPGEGLRHAAIRRWTAPRDGAISIRGAMKLLFDADTYQGSVRARIVSSRSGVALEKVVGPGTAALDVDTLPVKRGDTVDFVVDSHGWLSYDRFSWAPTLRMDGEIWSAEADFAGPREAPLTPWEKYAQVLLETNEFLFVD